MKHRHVSTVHSLRTQLLVGAVLLLVLTVAAVSYFLIIHQEHVLTAEMQETVTLQGRNIALSSEKFLLRDDPEFDLFPLVTRILGSTPRIESIVIVDNEGIIQGHADLVQVSKKYSPNLGLYHPAPSATSINPGELLYENEDGYLFLTPVTSSERNVGLVYLGYSKQDLHAGIRNAFQITLLVSIAALLVGIVVSFVFFRHISRPLRVMVDGVEALDGSNLETHIDMPTRNEFSILADAFNDMSRRIATAQKELIVKERMEHELEIAHEIQLSLLPREVKPPAGFEISHYYKSANEVGGDYVDIIQLGGNRVALAMADVSGKGVPGLVVMAMVRALLQDLVSRCDSPRDIISSLNKALRGNINDNMFVTAFVAILDGTTGRVTMSNAGHNPAVIYNQENRTTRMIKIGGPPLGPFDQDQFAAMIDMREVILQPGDLLLQYTDGLNESQNGAGEQFTINRLNVITQSHAPKGAKALVGQLVQEEASFRGGADQFDDITLLALSASFDKSRAVGLHKV